MQTRAIVLDKPKALSLRALPLTQPAAGDVVVEMLWSGISTGTERLLWSGDMPPFPGLKYPLVPGYESVGEVVAAGPEADIAIGDRVFVPGATCYGEVRGLFGGSASRVVLPAGRTTQVPAALGADATLLALAATAHHAVARKQPDLIIGHGVLGRLMARIVQALGGQPAVWEVNPDRREGASYPVLHPDEDARRDYDTICDVSGDPSILDALISRVVKGGRIVLAGFYADRLSFAFPMAFMREVTIQVAAEWTPEDMQAVVAMVAQNRLSLGGLITHRAGPDEAADAYRTAFEDAGCLKMILDWRSLS